MSQKPKHDLGQVLGLNLGRQKMFIELHPRASHDCNVTEEGAALIPSNVMLVNKLEQESLLAHPNTVLFIMHCGINRDSIQLNFNKLSH